jgi:hypothetical protein
MRSTLPLARGDSVTTSTSWYFRDDEPALTTRTG